MAEVTKAIDSECVAPSVVEKLRKTYAVVYQSGRACESTVVHPCAATSTGKYSRLHHCGCAPGN